MNANQVNDFLLAGIQSDKLSSGYSAELMNVNDISSLYSACQKYKITVPSVPIENKCIFINILSWYSYLNICAISVPQLYLLKRESQPERNLSLSGGYTNIFGHLNNPLRSSHTANMQSGYSLTASIISDQLPDGMEKEQQLFGGSLSTEDSGMRKEKDSNCVTLPIWAFNAHLNSGEVASFDDFIGVTTPVSEDFSYITMRKDFSYITTRGNSHYKNSHYYFFTLSSNIGYIDDAPAKSGVRRENLYNTLATDDAPSVFFYVAASQHLSFQALFAYTNSMVMLIGQPSGWLVSFVSSILTSVSVTALNERENSSGDSLDNTKEIVAMMTIPTQTHFKFLFLSIKRSDTTAKPFRIAATAPDERENSSSHYKNSHYYFFTLSSNIGYIDDAPAKSGVRRENLNIEKATDDAPSVFFYVAASQHLSFQALFAYTNSMVMLIGQPSGWLVSFSTSILTSVSVTAPNERENSSGDSFKKEKEIVAMMTIPTQTHFKFLFLSIKRSDTTAKPFRIAATAPDERENSSSHYKNSHYYFFTLSSNIGYIDGAPAKSGVRRGNLNIQKATDDAPSVFFYVAASQHLSFQALFAYTNSMVMLIGQPSGWLVSFCSSISTSVSVTALNERGNSGGDSLKKQKEIVAMMTIPTQTHFKFLFLSIKRSDTTAKPFRIAATAPDEHSARMMLVGDYILSFAGRIPVQVVAA